MMIAIPAMGSLGFADRAAEHFGRCASYVLMNEEGELVRVLENESVHGGGFGFPAEFLKRHGVDVLICKGLGPRALELCSHLNIKVYVLDGDLVSDLFVKWQKGPRVTATLDNVCEEHRK